MAVTLCFRGIQHLHSIRSFGHILEYFGLSFARETASLPGDYSVHFAGLVAQVFTKRRKLLPCSVEYIVVCWSLSIVILLTVMIREF